jgi:hypothetical protein
MVTRRGDSLHESLKKQSTAYGGAEVLTTLLALFYFLSSQRVSLLLAINKVTYDNVQDAQQGERADCITKRIKPYKLLCHHHRYFTKTNHAPFVSFVKGGEGVSERYTSSDSWYVSPPKEIHNKVSSLSG